MMQGRFCGSCSGYLQPAQLTHLQHHLKTAWTPLTRLLTLKNSHLELCSMYTKYMPVQRRGDESPLTMRVTCQQQELQQTCPSARYFPCLEEPARLDEGTLSVWVSCHQPKAALRDSRKPWCLPKLLYEKRLWQGWGMPLMRTSFLFRCTARNSVPKMETPAPSKTQTQP